MPSVDPRPSFPKDDRVFVPELAHDASYLAASAKIANLSMRVRFAIGFIRTKQEQRQEALSAFVQTCGAMSLTRQRVAESETPGQRSLLSDVMAKI